MTSIMGGAVPPEEAMPVPEEAMPVPAPEEEAAGRGGDIVLGHLTPGEIVLPLNVLSKPGILKKITSLFEDADVDINQYTVGHESNSVNPETGNLEFSWLSQFMSGGSRSRGRSWLSRVADLDIWKQSLAKQRADIKEESERNKSTFRVKSLRSQLDFKNKLRQIRSKEVGGPVVAVDPISTSGPKKALLKSKRKFAKRKNIVNQITQTSNKRPE